MPNNVEKMSTNYSPNFDLRKRSKRNIKYIIFHYTGMKNDKLAIKRLTDFNSKVSCHYYIHKNGKLTQLVPDLYIAWHAGKSSWKKFNLLNKNSIGIEISNPGHEFNYRNFSTKQINSLLKLSKLLMRKYKIEPKFILGHSDIAPKRKKDPGEKFPWRFLAKHGIGLWHTLTSNKLKINRNKKIDKIDEKFFYKNLLKIGYLNKDSKNFKSSNYLIKAFQRRYRQELINGKLDKECLLISENIVKKFV